MCVDGDEVSGGYVGVGMCVWMVLDDGEVGCGVCVCVRVRVRGGTRGGERGRCGVLEVFECDVVGCWCGEIGGGEVLRWGDVGVSVGEFWGGGEEEGAGGGGEIGGGFGGSALRCGCGGSGVNGEGCGEWGCEMCEDVCLWCEIVDWRWDV